MIDGDSLFLVAVILVYDVGPVASDASDATGIVLGPAAPPGFNDIADRELRREDLGGGDVLRGDARVAVAVFEGDVERAVAVRA